MAYSFHLHRTIGARGKLNREINKRLLRAMERSGLSKAQWISRTGLRPKDLDALIVGEIPLTPAMEHVISLRLRLGMPACHLFS
jgi:hypothetical protein